MVIRPRTPLLRALFGLLGLTLSVVAGNAAALPGDPAARGLDVFVHGATTAAAGDVVEVALQAFGFRAVTDTAPLAGATFEVGWDPDAVVAPSIPTVKVTADNDGRAVVKITVPDGPPEALPLLVGVRHGTHERVRSISVNRAPRARVDLRVADTRVVPGSTFSAWVRVVSAREAPLADEEVIVTLLEGVATRQRQTVRTDRGGHAMVRVRVPNVYAADWRWNLRAELSEGRSARDVNARGARDASASPPPISSTLVLSAREELPGTPTLHAAWETTGGSARPGDRVSFQVRLQDATGETRAGHAVRYWVGPLAATPKTDADWLTQSIETKTDHAGVVSGERLAPTLVKASGTTVVLLARAVVDGRPIEATSNLEVGQKVARLLVETDAPALVPGVTHDLLLRFVDAVDAPLVGELAVTGDGLDTRVTTNDQGEAKVTWKVPLGAGARRTAAGCPYSVAVALSVRPTAPMGALRGLRDTFSACVELDREAAGVARAVPSLVRPGERVTVSVQRPEGAARGPQSVVLQAVGSGVSIAGWLTPDASGTTKGELTIPEGAPPGEWTLSAFLPEKGRAARPVHASLVVMPKKLPTLAIRRTGGRPTPGGTIELDAQLTDGEGRGIPGSISAIVVDAFGGGDVDITNLDTRRSLCAGMLAHGASACDDLLADDALGELRRRALATARSTEKRPSKPQNDPSASAGDALDKAFADVVRSLEGAVLESTERPDSLLDARRKEGGRWVLNPELFSLVTDAMEEAPTTPGGEPFTLADLVAIDPQVTFDNVARRVTRLKLFNVLFAVRKLRSERGLDPDEPVFRDPNALLRRLVREHDLEDSALLDPWGGTLQYVKTATPPATPFLAAVRGYELRSPGPDGVLGNGDDVRDPFERVLRSNTPYAQAVQEDRLVDAKWDFIISEASVAGWKSLLEELTGTSLGGGGRGEGIGLGGTGSGSSVTRSGNSFGVGRFMLGIAKGDAFWTAPQRTDAEGKLHLRVPLGAVETTWRIALVAVPDGHGPVAQTVDVKSDLPLSARVDVGASAIEGDVVEAALHLRNRTDRPLDVTVDARAEGSAALEQAKVTQRVRVPARGAHEARVRVRSARAGEAKLVVTTRADGVPEDVVHHAWSVAPAGERRVFTRTAWVEGKEDLRLELDHGYAAFDAPRLVVERGYDVAIAGALGAIDVDRETSPRALLDAWELAKRVRDWATTKSDPRHRALALHADAVAQKAVGRFAFHARLEIGQDDAKSPNGSPLAARARMLTPATSKDDGQKQAAACPPEQPAKRGTFGASDDDDVILDLEPVPGATGVAPCWSAYVAATTRDLQLSFDAVNVARGVLALADRPHRAPLAASLANRLRSLVSLRDDGEIDGGVALVDRARRSTVYAALLRTSRLGPSEVPAPALVRKLAVLRDAGGGYGSPAATLAVVRALLAAQPDETGTTRIRVRVLDGNAPERVFDLLPSDTRTLTLPPATLAVSVETWGSGVVARLERPVIRGWGRPAAPGGQPVGLEVEWPADVRAGGTGELRVALRQDSLATSWVDARVPLPPGVSLAANVAGVTQLQGALLVHQNVESNVVLSLPLRFGLAGSFTVPEASAWLSSSAAPPVRAPARPLRVR